MTGIWPDEWSRSDFTEALGVSAQDCRDARPDGEPQPPIATTDIKAVHEHAASYHDEADNKPPGDGAYDGTELDLVALLELHDGRWAVLYGWNDYTGWGCQDGAGLRFAPSRDEAIRYGMDEAQRTRLGLA